MADYFPRSEFQKLGLSEPALRILEKLAILADTVSRITDAEGDLATLEDQIVVLDEAIEDANLSLESLDARIDDQENGNGPYVKKTGDTMSGALNVNALLECDSLRVNTAPVASGDLAATHTVAINVDGAVLKFLASNV